jgi:hypothetical protein
MPHTTEFSYEIRKYTCVGRKLMMASYGVKFVDV